MRHTRPAPRAPRIVLGLLLLGALPACQGRRLLGTEGAGAASGTPTAVPASLPSDGALLGARAGRGGGVNLSARDLAPVDWYVDARNAQWILGDEVLVEASREYFGQILSIASRVGSVERTDDVQPDVTTTTLRFVMARNQTAVENNPRLMIGTGLTVSARQVLRLRLFKTNDSDTPVSLRVTASGSASRGRKDKVEQRAPTLQVGGNLRRAQGGWKWSPIG